MIEVEQDLVEKSLEILEARYRTVQSDIECGRAGTYSVEEACILEGMKIAVLGCLGREVDPDLIELHESERFSERGMARLAGISEFAKFIYSDQPDPWSLVNFADKKRRDSVLNSDPGAVNFSEDVEQRRN